VLGSSPRQCQRVPFGRVFLDYLVSLALLLNSAPNTNVAVASASCRVRFGRALGALQVATAFGSIDASLQARPGGTRIVFKFPPAQRCPVFSLSKRISFCLRFPCQLAICSSTICHKTLPVSLPLSSLSPDSRLPILKLSLRLLLLESSRPSIACGWLPTHRGVRAIDGLLRSVYPFCVTVGGCSTPSLVWSEYDRSLILSPKTFDVLSAAVRLRRSTSSVESLTSKPISYFGCLELTMLHTFACRVPPGCHSHLLGASPDVASS